MRKTVCFVLLAMSACAEGVGGDDVNPPLSPVNPEPPTVTPVEPPDDIDGEYVMRVEPTSLVCNGEALEAQSTLYSLANVVEQNYGSTFDVLSRGVGGYYDFSHWGIERKDNGLIEDDESFAWLITPGYPPLIFLIDAVGSIVSDTLAFVNHWDIGWNDNGGVWHPECDFVYENIGSRRYRNWDNKPRPSIDGQALVWHENLVNSLGSLDEPSFKAIDIITQNDSDSAFDLKWTRFNIKNVPRAVNGSVAYSFWSGYSLFTINGVVENHYPDVIDYLDIIITWDEHDATTGAVLWRLEDRYTGVPRFQPHSPGNSEPPTGAYNMELAQAADTCDGVLNTKRYVVESLPVDNSQIELWFAGLKLPPITPNVDDQVGVSNLGYWDFTYLLSDIAINGDTISFTMHAEAVWSWGELAGQTYCTTDYVASGVKRYSNLFPAEQ